MKPLDVTPKSNANRRCLVAAAAVILILAGLAAAVYLTLQADRREFERKQAERCKKFFETVKAGDDGSKIFVFLDPRLIEMLASDPDCVSNLTTLRLDMADLSGPQTAAAAKLVNVKRISFYDCGGAENLLTAVKGLQSIEELGFDTTRLSDDGVRLLATFPNLKKVYFAWVNDEAREKLIRDTLSGVEIDIGESNYANR